jgi:hypothetical protein
MTIPPKIVIRNRDTNAVLFEYQPTEQEQSSGLALRAALESAVKGDANLDGANLRVANLRGANLDGANLVGANLDGANLGGAYLGGAYLGVNKLIGDLPILMNGPSGSRADYLTAYLTDAGLYLRAGCFFGDRATFEAALSETHGDNNHAREYRAALALIDAHAEIWTPAEAQKEPA